VKTKTYISRILWYQVAGFVILLIFPWVIEIFDVPKNVAENDRFFNWQECLLENILVIMVAVPLMIITARFLSRLYYLEGFLRICAWCKKLENNDEWIPIETYFKEKFETESSHGICDVCLKEAQQKIENNRKK
jgi:hypothetical protein